MNIPILFEEETFTVIDKPAGIVVNRASSVHEETIQDWIEAQPYWSKIIASDSEFYSRSGIVHRIDKETSGVLLIAKTIETFTKLQEQFKNHTIKKTYVALVHGKVVPQTGIINAPIGRLPWNREQFGIVPGGKESVTSYTVIEYGNYDIDNSKGVITFIQLNPESGRTHQIRVHMKYIGFPLLGDYLYAGRKVSKQDRVWAERVMLHAQSIEFENPQDQKVLIMKAGIPEDMKKVMEQCSLKSFGL